MALLFNQDHAVCYLLIIHEDKAYLLGSLKYAQRLNTAIL